jgi:2OG-Fe(II) oxygenase superfamily
VPALLLSPNHCDQPFAFFSVDCAFAPEHCAALEQLFLLEDAWQHQDGEFYRCSMREVSESIPLSFQTEVLERMRELTGLPLVNRVVVSAQRMQPGQVIGVHSDRSLLGYEMVRLIVQLNRDWQIEHGGVLQLFDSAEGKVVLGVHPEFNTALGFLLHADSYHAVSEVKRLRQTVVFNFWHMANTPELAAHINVLFADLQFSEFPEALNPVATAAESSLPEALTFRAGTAALALHRWGYNDECVVNGYRFSAGLSVIDTRDPETYAAILLADWVAYLYRESFDLARWNVLKEKLQGFERYSRLAPTWQLCLPHRPH